MMIEQGVILVAGVSPRLSDIRLNRTRSMLPVLGKPITVRIMEAFRKAGIHRFVVVIGSRDGELATHINETWYRDDDVQFVMHAVENGTARALLSASNAIEGDFLLTTIEQIASTWAYQQLIEAYESTQQGIVMIEAVESAGIADVSNNNNPLPLAILPHEALALAQKLAEQQSGVLNLAQLWQPLLPLLALRAEHLAPVYRLENSRDWLALTAHFLEEGQGSYILSDVDPSVVVNPPVRIDPGVRIGNGAVIGPYVYAETGAKIGEKAQVSNSIILANGAIAAEEHIEQQVITQ